MYEQSIMAKRAAASIAASSVSRDAVESTEESKSQSAKKSKTKEYLIPLARLVKHCREADGMSQSKFAQFAGVPQSAVSQLESAQVEPGARYMKSLAIALYRLTGFHFTRESLYALIYPDEPKYPWLDKKAIKKSIDYFTRGNLQLEIRGIDSDMEASQEGCKKLVKALQAAINRKFESMAEAAKYVDVPIERLALILTGSIEHAPTFEELNKLQRLQMLQGRRELSYTDLLQLVYGQPPESESQLVRLLKTEQQKQGLKDTQSLANYLRIPLSVLEDLLSGKDTLVDDLVINRIAARVADESGAYKNAKLFEKLLGVADDNEDENEENCAEEGDRDGASTH